MKKKVVYLILIFFVFQNLLQAYSSNPRDFVNELVNEALSKLSDKNLNKEQKTAFIEKVAKENVDIEALGLYTLGELRKSSSKEDISNYQISFEKYFLKSLTSRLTDYSSSKFEVLNEDKKGL
jgi:phospholipid transport system substrate-binding protein